MGFAEWGSCAAVLRSACINVCMCTTFFFGFFLKMCNSFWLGVGMGLFLIMCIVPGVHTLVWGHISVLRCDCLGEGGLGRVCVYLKLFLLCEVWRQCLRVLRCVYVGVCAGFFGRVEFLGALI